MQWVDGESADALAFASRRLGHDRVAIVVTQRSSTPLHPGWSGIDVVELGGLSAGPALELLGPGFATGVAARLVEDTAGNPLALVECRRVLGVAERTGAAALPPTPAAGAVFVGFAYRALLGDRPPAPLETATEG